MPLFTKTAEGLVLRKGHRKTASGLEVLSSSGGGGGGAPPGTYAPARVWDFGTGNLSQWSATHGAAPSVVSSGRSDFPFMGTFLANDSTRASFDATDIRRTEMTDGDYPRNGNIARNVEQWWGWSTRFPAGTVAPSAHPTTGGWGSFVQWHHSGSTGSVPLWFSLVADGSSSPSMRLLTKGGLTTNSGVNFLLGSVPLGTWMDFVLYVKWNDDPALGRVMVKVNGTTVLAMQSVANLYTDGAGTQQMYVKQGFYGNRYSSGTTPNPAITVDHTGMRRGDTEASITP